MSSVVDGMFLHGGCLYDNSNVTALQVRQYISPTENKCWLRIPIRSPIQTLKRSERHSCYGGVTKDETAVGFHRVGWELCLEEGRTVFDWRTNKSVVYPSSIVKEGRMRNGINDSNHRGVWFYLHWSMPWSPSPMEIVVEVEVAESSIHKTSKWHQKYCAAAEPPAFCLRIQG